MQTGSLFIFPSCTVMDPNGSLANGNMARMDKDEIDKRLKIETASHPSFDTPLDVAKVAAMQAVCLAIVPEEWLHATAYRTAARARLIMYVHRQKGKSGNTSRQPPITVIAVTAACIFLFFLDLFPYCTVNMEARAKVLYDAIHRHCWSR